MCHLRCAVLLLYRWLIFVLLALRPLASHRIASLQRIASPRHLHHHSVTSTRVESLHRSLHRTGPTNKAKSIDQTSMRSSNRSNISSLMLHVLAIAVCATTTAMAGRLTRDTAVHSNMHHAAAHSHAHAAVAGAPVDATHDNDMHDNEPLSSSSSDGIDHSGMSMPMFFSLRMVGFVLFPFIDVTSTTGYILFSIIVGLACVLREYLHVYRLELEKENHELQLLHASAGSSQGIYSSDGTVRLETHRKCGIITTPVMSSILYALNMGLAYLIMLVVMTYDAIFFLIILSTSGGAHFYFQHHHHTISMNRTNGVTSNRRTRGRQVSTDESAEEKERLTPMFDSPRNGPIGTTASKKAAMQLAITKDCCES